MTKKELIELPDSAVLGLYSQWCENNYCAGFLDGDAQNVESFIADMLGPRPLPQRGSPQLTEYELRMLLEFRRQCRLIS